MPVSFNLTTCYDHLLARAIFLIRRFLLNSVAPRLLIAVSAAPSVMLGLAASLFVSCVHTSEPPIQLPDTTSHNFTWKVEHLGDGISSFLEDVAIINDSLAYAVGAVYVRDSVGNWDPDAFNVVKWNGSEWKLLRIPFVGVCTAVTYPPITAIWGFSQNSILLTNGGSIVTYDGVTASMDCRMNSLLVGAINKIFATTAEDIYAVGNSGAIVHYGNGTWQKVESGTTLPIQDIWGSVASTTYGTEVLALASTKYLAPVAMKLLRLQEAAVTPVSDAGLPGSLSGLWFSPGRQYYVVGDGLYMKDQASTQTPWVRVDVGVTGYNEAIRGNSANDIMAVGHFGTILHYNGTTWHNYQNEIPILQDAVLHAVAVKGNLVVAVGEDFGHGVVAVGRRP